MYVKAHPFNYIKRFGRSKRVQCFGRPHLRTQTVYMKDGTVKNIYHTIRSYKRGRTLAEMVYESYYNHN